MLEKVLERVFAKEVRAAGGWSTKMVPTEAGTPDRLVVFPPGRFSMVELKTETGRLSAIQLVRHRRMSALGVEVVVLYGPADVRRWVAEMSLL